MCVPELAIQAQEKGEREMDTFCTIEFYEGRVKLTKRSRVNADLVVDVPMGEEYVQHVPPWDRKKTT